MSTTIIELGDGASGQVSEDRRTLRRVFSVDTSSALTVVDVLQLSGIPVYGDPHPLESTQVCQNVTAVPDDGGFGFIVTAEYAAKSDEQVATSADSFDPASDSFVGSGFPAGSPSAWASDDPCRGKWTFELNYERVEVYPRSLMELDANDDPMSPANPNLNTANHLMMIAKESIYVPIISMSKSVPDSWTTPSAACSIQGSVNFPAVSVAGFTIPKYGAIMRTFHIRRAYWGRSANPYWEVRVEILCMYKSFPDEKALMIIQQVDTRDINNKPIEVTNGVLQRGTIGANGLITSTPYYRRFRPSAIYDWTLLQLPKKL